MENNDIKSFKEQLIEFEYGYWDSSKPFIVENNSYALAQAKVNNRPIVMTVKTLQKLKQKHDIPLECISELPKMIVENNVLLLESYTFNKPSVCMYLDQKGSDDNPLFVVFHLDKHSGHVQVNELVSLYERKNVEFTISKTYEKGLKIWPNNKTKDWLESAGLQLPLELTSLLNGNYVEFSKNHQIPSNHTIPQNSSQVKNRTIENSGKDLGLSSPAPIAGESRENPNIDIVQHVTVDSDLETVSSDPPIPGTGAVIVDKAHDKGVGPSKT